MKRLLRTIVALTLIGVASLPGVGTSEAESRETTRGNPSRTLGLEPWPSSSFDHVSPIKSTRGPRPDAYLSSSVGKVKASGGLGCWDDGPASLCACGQVGYLNDPLVARQGEPLLLRFTKRDSPNDLNVSLDGTKIDVLPTNPAMIPIDVPRGRHYLDIGSRWDQGDLAHAVKFDVR